MEPNDSRSARTSVAFRIFRGTFVTWNELFQQAADFASGIDPDRLIGISHSGDNTEGVVTVWYWR